VLEIYFSAAESGPPMIAKMIRAELRATNPPPEDGSDLAHKVLVNAKKRHPNSHIDRQDGQDRG
jgi:hypothetical protein